MLGGGTFLTQNKVLPGAYINFISANRASAVVSDRGYVAMPLILDWGIDGKVFTVEAADFQKESKKIFGYSYDADEIKGLRDLFKNAKTLYCYKVNDGVKATNTLAEAKYKGARGNAITIVIEENLDNTFTVNTLFDGKMVDTQTVADNTELVENDYVVFKTTATLAANAGEPLTGGTTGSATGTEYQDFLDAIEEYSFNTLGCLSIEDTIKDLFVQFTKRMRDEQGVKFQTVLYDCKADYEGVINVKNTVKDANELTSSLVYWTVGASAGCAVNKSLTNVVYDGDFVVNTKLKQSELTKAIQDGEFTFHKVGDDVRVLTDINSFVSVTKDKNIDFTKNQVIRVLDQIGNDIAALFNKQYIGKVQNDKDGRISLWNDILTYNKQLESIRAIENVNGDEIVVEAGDTKDSVVVQNPITPVCAMEKLYMTCVIS